MDASKSGPGTSAEVLTPVRLSTVRKLLLWLMDPRRSSPWVSVSVVVDISQVLAYLEELNSRLEGGFRVSIHHLVTAVVGRLYHEFPQINRRIVGGQIFQAPSVGIAVPVSLLNHKGGATRELSVINVLHAEKKSLLEIARETTDTVRAEREGRVSDKAVEALNRLLDAVPDAITHRVMDFVTRFYHIPWLANQAWKVTPVTTLISNVGAALGSLDGALVRGGAVDLTDGIVHIGSLWGLMGVQDEVIPVDGKPAVRPMLPLVFVFDHRLIDGVMAGRILSRFREYLRDPEGSGLVD